MALARARRDRGIDYWPGFVDALSTLILSIIFMLTVFVVVQFFLSQEVTNKDTVLSRLNAQIAQLTEQRTVPEFKPGDTVRVNVKVIEGNRERVQAFEGVCIARRNRGINSSFTVRKISYGEGVERVFPLFSPRIDSIDVSEEEYQRMADFNEITFQPRLFQWLCTRNGREVLDAF